MRPQSEGAGGWLPQVCNFVLNPSHFAAAYTSRQKEPTMNEFVAATVTAIADVALDAAKETATAASKFAWGKLKGVLGWTTEPAPADVKALAEKTLAANPALATQVQQIVNNYRQQVGGFNVGTLGSINLTGATVGELKQANVGQNSGTINL